jgi:hypothetical protein
VAEHKHYTLLASLRPIDSVDGRTDPPGHDTTCQLGRWYKLRLVPWSMGRPIDLGTGDPLGHWRRSAVLELVTVLWPGDVP